MESDDDSPHQRPPPESGLAPMFKRRRSSDRALPGHVCQHSVNGQAGTSLPTHALARGASVGRRERQLRVRLDTWLRKASVASGGAQRVVNILIASCNTSIIDEIALTIQVISNSNIANGLPAIAMNVYGATTSAEVLGTLQRDAATPPSVIVLLSESMLDAYHSCREEGQDSIISFNETGPGTYEQATLTRCWGVIDTLPWP